MEESPRSASRKARQAKCTNLENLEILEKAAQIAKKPTRKELGKGAFGKVYSLQDHVVKEITFPANSPPHVIDSHKKLFEKEVTTWKELSQIKPLRPYIPHFCGADLQTDIHYDMYGRKHETQKGYIIQLEEKVTDMRNILNNYSKKNRKFQFDYGYNFFNNVIKGFEILRAAGYLHRDIKPENILIRLDKSSPYFEHPIIIDFGFACKMPCKESGLMGTLRYLPMNWQANQYRRRRTFRVGAKKITVKSHSHILPPEYSKHSDDYALSILLHELFYLIDWTDHDAERETAIDEIRKRRRAILPYLAASLARFKGVKDAPAAADAPLFGSFFGEPPAATAPIVSPLVPAGKGTKRRRSGSKSASASASALNEEAVNALLALREGRSKRARSRSGAAPVEKPVLLGDYLSNNA